MAWLETIRLCFDNNLIISDTPSVIPIQTLAHIHNKGMDVESFGLFDTAAPNFVTYYPDVKKEDLTPQESDYVRPTFRALSEVIVHRKYNPIDFGMNGVLKKSKNLLIGQTIFPNHEALVGNELGSIVAVEWEDETTHSKGFKIPAGINTKLQIDGKVNPKIARSLNSNPPSIHSSSVTVEFLWEKSHPAISEDDFWKNLGKLDADKNMYRRIATLINRYDEMSFVRKGADPYAQKKNDKGEIVNPTEADIRNNPKTGLAEKYFFFDFKNIVQNSEDEEENKAEPITIPNKSNENDNDKNKTVMNKAFLLALAATFGLTGDKFTDANITEEILKAALVEIKNTSNQNTALALLFKKLSDAGIKTVEGVDALQQNSQLYIDNKTKLESLPALEKFQKDRLDELRAKVKETYLKLMDNKPADATLTLIKEGNWDILVGLQAHYETSLNEKFPLTCKGCGSKEVNRASATLGNNEDKGKGTAGEQGQVDKGSFDNLLNTKRKAGGLKMAGMETVEEKKDEKK